MLLVSLKGLNDYYNLVFRGETRGGYTNAAITPHPFGFRPALYQFHEHHLSSLALAGGGGDEGDEGTAGRTVKPASGFPQAVIMIDLHVPC